MSEAFRKLMKKTIAAAPNLIGDGTKSALKWCPLESPLMTYMFGGGVPIGRIIRFRGPNSAGKSAVCTYCAAALQKHLPEITGRPDQKVVIYVDFERTFEMKYARTIGLDTSPDYFVHLKPETIEDAAEFLDEAIRTGDVAAVIWDSDGASPVRTQMNDEFGKATFGGSARITAEFLKKFNILFADRDITTLWISQERANMKPMARLPQPTGGEAIPFYSSIICRITKSDDIKDADGIIGIEMTIRDMKNKCSVPFRLAEGVKLFFDGGFNADAEYIDFFLKLNFMVQKGAYFQFDFEGEHYSLQGRQKLMDWLYEHKDTYEKWKTDVRNMLSGHVDALDKDNYAVNEETGEALNIADQKKAEAYALKTTGGKVEDETEATADEALKD